MENPNFFLEGIVKEKNQLQDFEGPLSLILMLLSKNKIEIRDIKIADILDQYLEYLDKMQSMDLEVASEFVQMASHLLYIKTRTLLAGDEEVSELEVLMASLEQLKCRDIFAAVQKVTPELKKASELGLLYYAKLPEPLPKAAREYEYRHEPVDLLKALYGIYSRGGKTPDSLSPPQTPWIPFPGHCWTAWRSLSFPATPTKRRYRLLRNICCPSSGRSMACGPTSSEWRMAPSGK